MARIPARVVALSTVVAAATAFTVPGRLGPPASCRRACPAAMVPARGAPLVPPARPRLARGAAACVAVDSIEMFRGPYTKPEFLPIGMARGFPKWILAAVDSEGEPELRPMFNSASYGEEDGWVDPFSFEELWLPSDLPAPVMRPSLSCVAKDGQIRYLMPALELSVQAGGKLWWNRGMNSIPLAARWMDVNAVNIGSLNLVGFSQGGYESAKVSMQLEGEETPKDDPSAWVKLFQCSASEAMLDLVETLAGPAGSVIGSGFHVVHIPLQSHALLESPETGSRMRVFLTDASFERSQPQTVEYSSEHEFDSGEGYSELDILVRAAAAGSKSEYLPKVYKELYSAADRA